MNKLLPYLLFLMAFTLSAQQEPLKVHFNTLTEVSEDGEFEVDVRLSDFENIYAMQMFFFWDSTVMRVNAVTEFSDDIPDFDGTMVTLPEQDIARPEKGKLRISWIKAQALTIPDDSHLMTLSFTALGMACDSTSIIVDNLGAQQSEMIEVLTDADINIGVEVDDFVITIPGPDCLTSTEDLDDLTFSLYPNPVKDNLQIELNRNLNQDAIIWFYDLKGKVYLKHEFNQSTKIDMTNLAPANYLYDIRADGKTIQKGKVVKI